MTMQIINICEHPIHGRCYLWSSGNMQYALGTVSKNFMKWDGWYLEEVVKQIKVKGFSIIPWAKEND